MNSSPILVLPGSYEDNQMICQLYFLNETFVFSFLHTVQEDIRLGVASIRRNMWPSTTNLP